MSYRDLLFHSREENRKRICAVWRITEIANRIWRVGLVKNTRNQAVRGYGWEGVWVMPERALPE